MEGGVIGEGQLIEILDRLVLRHRLSGGQTIVEQFVGSRPDLSAPEREMLLGWRHPLTKSSWLRWFAAPCQFLGQGIPELVGNYRSAMRVQR
jgi:hypothetical protein